MQLSLQLFTTIFTTQMEFRTQEPSYEPLLPLICQAGTAFNCVSMSAKIIQL